MEADVNGTACKYAAHNWYTRDIVTLGPKEDVREVESGV